jgi:peptidyl-prolyl cis-trans isomerase C
VVLTPSPSATDPVVARVGERPILASDLRHQMSEGQSAQEALQALVRQELLAMEAKRRNLARHPEVRAAQRKAMVRKLLSQKLVSGYNEEDIPMELVEKAYRINSRRYNRPELRIVRHILVFARRKSSEVHHRRARAIAEEIRKLATGQELSPEQFEAIVPVIRAKHPDVKIRLERLGTARRGSTVRQFADASFELSDPGQVSPVVRTRYGYHVIYLDEAVPAKHTPIDEVEEEIRDRILGDARREAFLSWVDELQKKRTVAIHADRLAPETAGADKKGEE